MLQKQQMLQQNMATYPLLPFNINNKLQQKIIYSINNNNNKKDDVYGAVIMAEKLRVSPGSFDKCIMAPSSCRPKTKPDDLGCESACTGCQKLHPPSPFIIITQPES